MLGGNPLIWYRAFKDRHVTWIALRASFIRQFTKPDNDYLIERQLQNRIQLPGESFGIYFACMELLFKKLSKRKSDAEKLEYLIRNLDDFYLNRIHEGYIQTTTELGEFCKALERSREILKRRRMPQFPLAEPSLQGRPMIFRAKVNELNFESDRGVECGVPEGLPGFDRGGNANRQVIMQNPMFNNPVEFHANAGASYQCYPEALPLEPRASTSYHNHPPFPFAPVSEGWISHPYVGSQATSNGPGSFGYIGQNNPAGVAIAAQGFSLPGSSQQGPNQGRLFENQNYQSSGLQISSNPEMFSTDCYAIRELSGRCFNCKNPGHSWKMCPIPKKLFCHRCGSEGKTLLTCSNCSGNQAAGPRT